MSRLLTLVVTGVSALALSTFAAPVSPAGNSPADSVPAAGISAKSQTGNWCC
jgi:hypothetical protein